MSATVVAMAAVCPMFRTCMAWALFISILTTFTGEWVGWGVSRVSGWGVVVSLMFTGACAPPATGRKLPSASTECCLSPPHFHEAMRLSFVWPSSLTNKETMNKH